MGYRQQVSQIGLSGRDSGKRRKWKRKKGWVTKGMFHWVGNKTSRLYMLGDVQEFSIVGGPATEEVEV